MGDGLRAFAPWPPGPDRVGLSGPLLRWAPGEATRPLLLLGTPVHDIRPDHHSIKEGVLSLSHAYMYLLFHMTALRTYILQAAQNLLSARARVR